MSKNTAGYFYEPRKINRVFGLSSLALLASTLWMVWQDHTREWKGYQQQARDLEIRRLKAEFSERRSAVEAGEALSRARARLEVAAGALAMQGDTVAGQEKAVQAATSVWYKADQDFRAAKAEADAARYRFEEARLHRRGEQAAEAEYALWLKRVEALKLVQETSQAALEDARAALAGTAAERDAAAREETALLSEVTRLEKRLAGLAHTLVNDWVRDQPGVDYMAPLIKLPSALAPPDLTDDYNFMQVQKMDRCNACHVNIDRPGFEGESQPFSTHPRLDLYLSSRSAHPLGTFGCTTCHGGQGSATDFLHAYHTPGDEAQSLVWEGKYGWLHFQEEHAALWSYPMLPKPHVEASCRKCHADRVSLDAAPSYSRGKHVFETAGCWGCHKVEGFEPRLDPKEGRVPTAADQERLPKPGPDLLHIGCKLTPEYTAKWLADPKRFRAHTRMPSFFGVSPDMDEAARLREADEIRAITEYLFRRSLSSQGPEFPPGDPGSGKKLVETVGCLACHAVGEAGPGGARVDLSRRHADFDAFAPDLAGIGSKTNQGWLFNWLRNPKHYFPAGRMPDLRLTDAEAADAAAYLMTLRDEAFEALPAPAGDPARMRAILTEKLRSKESKAVVDYLLDGAPMPNELLAVPEDQRPRPIPGQDIPMVLGEHTLRRYGCNACHVIPGFADDKGIGAELTQVGSKDLAQVDFGFLERFHEKDPFSESALRTRHAWLEQKIKDPRLFDQGRAKAPLDRLIMPRFTLTDADAKALVTFLLSLNKQKVPLHRQERLAETQAALEKGRRLIKDANCTACHVVGLAPAAMPVQVPGDEKGRQAWFEAHRAAWLADPLLLTPKGDPERAAGSQDAAEKMTREKAGDRMALLSEARSFLVQKPGLGPQARELLARRGVDASGCNWLAEVLDQVERKRRTADPFRLPVPFLPRVAGLGEGLPGRWIADRATATPELESGKFAPPFLMDLGARVHPGWLHGFLLDPAREYARRDGQPIRPAVPLRMPTFGFTEAQATALTRYFALTAEASYPFSAEPEPARDPGTLKAAHVLLTDENALGCRSCHVVGGESKGPPVGPDLDFLAGRLRRDWLKRFVVDPKTSQPFAVMPPPYPRKADGTLSDENINPELNLLDNDPERQFEAILDYLLLPREARGK